MLPGNHQVLALVERGPRYVGDGGGVDGRSPLRLGREWPEVVWEIAGIQGCGDGSRGSPAKAYVSIGPGMQRQDLSDLLTILPLEAKARGAFDAG